VKKVATTAAAAAVILTGLTGPSTSSGAVLPTAPASGSASARSQHVVRLSLRRVESRVPRYHHFLRVDRLRFLPSHKIAGYDNVASVFNPKKDRLRFWMSLTLDGGLIDTYFSLTPGPNRYHGQITGGSGKYRGIEGTVHVRNFDSGRTVYTLRYRL
jgi:hypothetical protein